MSSTDVQPRRLLSERREQTVRSLADATIDELGSVGYHDLSVRAVARRAGVAPATAYTYFASKEHLIATVFWRRLNEQPDIAIDRRTSAAKRATDALMSFVSVVSGESDLAAASTVALLSDDPEVSQLRRMIGGELHARLLAALGDDAPRPAIRTLELALAGALIEIGTHHLTYEELPALLMSTAQLVLGKAPA